MCHPDNPLFFDYCSVNFTFKYSITPTPSQSVVSCKEDHNVYRIIHRFIEQFLQLGGENSKDYDFTGLATTDEMQDANSRKTEYALPAVEYDGEKKKHDESDDQ